MYLDQEKYATYIAAYKTFMMDTARIMVKEVGSAVSDESLATSVEQIFELETGIASVSDFNTSNNTEE